MFACTILCHCTSTAAHSCILMAASTIQDARRPQLSRFSFPCVLYHFNLIILSALENQKKSLPVYFNATQLRRNLRGWESSLEARLPNLDEQNSTTLPHCTKIWKFHCVTVLAASMERFLPMQTARPFIAFRAEHVSKNFCAQCMSNAVFKFRQLSGTWVQKGHCITVKCLGYRVIAVSFVKFLLCGLFSSRPLCLESLERILL